jgi:hypothetical protein
MARDPRVLGSIALSVIACLAIVPPATAITMIEIKTIEITVTGTIMTGTTVIEIIRIAPFAGLAIPVATTTNKPKIPTHRSNKEFENWMQSESPSL